MKHIERKPCSRTAPDTQTATEDSAVCVLTLDDTEATVHAGRELGRALLCHRNVLPPSENTAPDESVHVILLYGDLGSGKTTFTRGLVSALPGGDDAEVASPSFTLCNSYPTTPPVLHCDLYRSEGALPDEVDEALDAEAGLVLVEWAERLPAAILPRERLDICFQSCENERLMTLTPHGGAACRVLQEFQRLRTSDECSPQNRL